MKTGNVNIEYRFHGNYFNEDVFNNDLINTISIGSEGCMYQLPQVDQIIKTKRKAVDHDKNFTLVLPKTPQKFLDKEINIIKSLNADDRDYMVVFNDYGLLYQCKKDNLLPDKVCIGRSISRSFEDCLWYEHILRNEDDTNKKTMIQNNMYDEDKKDYLDDFNVVGVECNMLKNQEDSYSNLSKLGYKVNVHYKYVTIAFSRACQTAKYYRTKTGNCSHLCDKPINIVMNKIWTRDVSMESREQEINRKIAKLNPEFILYGNVLYRESKDKLKEISLDNVDNLIFDSRFIACNELESVIAKRIS